jgi:hypothetical protein
VAECELLYRAGSGGLSHLGIPDCRTPHWYCACGGWRKTRDHKGSPFRETAMKHWRKHVREARAAAPAAQVQTETED